MTRRCALVVALAMVPSPISAQRGVDGEELDPSLYQRVTRSEIRRAISLERDKGYDITASTNASRLWAHTAFLLVAWARERSPRGPALFIHEDDYYAAYLGAAGLTQAQAPDWVRLSWEYGQRTLIEYRMDHVMETAQDGRRPLQALAVLTWWPPSDQKSDRYQFEDTLSSPRLLVVNEREVRYRLMEFDGYLMWDEISGVRGRPTSGALGLLFRIVGTGSVRWTRIAISDDGWQVVRGKATKLGISKTTTVAVMPDGTADEVPEDRSDLMQLAETIERDVRLAYLPWPF